MFIEYNDAAGNCFDLSQEACGLTGFSIAPACLCLLGGQRLCGSQAGIIQRRVLFSGGVMPVL
jgi:hypothetical protein